MIGKNLIGCHQLTVLENAKILLWDTHAAISQHNLWGGQCLSMRPYHVVTAVRADDSWNDTFLLIQLEIKMKKYGFVQSACSPYTLREGDNFADVISGDSAFKCRSLWHWPLITEVHAYTNKTKALPRSLTPIYMGSVSFFASGTSRQRLT